MATDLLDLTTLIEQPTIRINKVSYEILHPDQLGVLDFQRLATMAGSISALTKKRKITDEDAVEVSAVIKDLTDRIMRDIPAEVRDGLTESQRLAVAEVFMMLPRATGRMRKRNIRVKPKANSSDGSKPPSDASDSTAATPSAG
jgi:hypothetical protein